MIITAVRYRKLITGPGYSHQAVEAEAGLTETDIWKFLDEPVEAF